MKTEEEWVLMGIGPLGSDKNVLKLVVVTVAPLCGCNKKHLIVDFKMTVL